MTDTPAVEVLSNFEIRSLEEGVSILRPDDMRRRLVATIRALQTDLGYLFAEIMEHWPDDAKEDWNVDQLINSLREDAAEFSRVQADNEPKDTEIAMLREVLEKYGRHFRNKRSGAGECSYYHGRDDCTCGFEAALSPPAVSEYAERVKRMEIVLKDVTLPLCNRMHANGGAPCENAIRGDATGGFDHWCTPCRVRALIDGGKR